MRDYGRMATARTSDAERHWLRVLSTLNEAQARLYVAEKALELGRGGISRLAELTGMSRPTIYKGAAELQAKRGVLAAEVGRIRRVGGGRKRVEEVDPTMKKALTQILEETTAGDSMSPLKWTAKSTRTIAAELSRRGQTVSAVTVGRCLRDMGYSLQANVKTLEGPQHPDRDAQFRHINAQVKAFVRSGDQRWSRWTRRKRSWWADSRMPAGAGNPAASRRRCRCMTSPVWAKARRLPTAPMTWLRGCEVFGRAPKWPSQFHWRRRIGRNQMASFRPQASVGWSNSPPFPPSSPRFGNCGRSCP